MFNTKKKCNRETIPIEKALSFLVVPNGVIQYVTGNSGFTTDLAVASV